MQSQPAQDKPSPPRFETIDSFEELLAAAESRREISLKLSLRNCVRLVSFESGKAVFELTSAAPKNFVSDLKKKIEAWTGHPWALVISSEGGQASMRERDEAARDALFADAGRNETVSAVIAAFPGAKIVDVRFNGPVEADAEPIAAPEETDDRLDEFFGE